MSQVGSTCYSSDAAAVAAVASAEVGKVVSVGSSVYVVDASPASGSSITYTLNPVGPGTAIIKTVSVDIPSCQLMDWADGMLLGWLVAGVWLAVAAVMHIREAAHS